MPVVEGPGLRADIFVPYFSSDDIRMWASRHLVFRNFRNFLVPSSPGSSTCRQLFQVPTLFGMSSKRLAFRFDFLDPRPEAPP